MLHYGSKMEYYQINELPCSGGQGIKYCYYSAITDGWGSVPMRPFLNKGL